MRPGAKMARMVGGAGRAASGALAGWACLLASGCGWPGADVRGIMELIFPPRAPREAVLLNLSADAGGVDDPFEPGRPTVAIAHGLNPLPEILRYSYLEDYAAAITARLGTAVNIAAFDYNGEALVSLDPTVNLAHAMALGRQMGRELAARGVTDGGQVQLIGHSMGAFVVTLAASELGGVGQITLIDPAATDTAVLVADYGLLDVADEVENYWTDAFGGFGAELEGQNVFNYRVDARELPVAVTWEPLHWAHMSMVLWYEQTIGQEDAEVGFARSLAIGGP